jgi:octaprenyl-diphosphate synthase
MDDILHAEAVQLARARQSLDESTYFAIIRGKTAALFRWACGAGACAAGLGEADIRALEVFGEHVGMAFQLMDDQLDVSGQADAMGKRPFADLLNGKWTYPALVVSRLQPAAGKLLEASLQDPAVLEDPSARSQVVAALSAPEVLAATRARAKEHIDRALEALQSAPPCLARDLLAALARSSLERNH